MSPSPEEIDGSQTAAEPAQSAPNPPAPGLQLEARVKAPTWEISIAAVVQDFTPGEVILLVHDHIAPGTHVTVQLSTSYFDGEILLCARTGSGYKAHVSFDDVDATGLRRTPRFPVRIPALVFANTTGASIEGTIVDISGEGLGMLLAGPVPVAANVAVQSAECVAFGVVRHCRERSPGRFRAGIQLFHLLRHDPDLAKASESSWINWLGFGRRNKPERPKGWS